MLSLYVYQAGYKDSEQISKKSYGYPKVLSQNIRFTLI